MRISIRSHTLRIAFLVPLTLCCLGRVESTTADPRGIYIYSSNVATISSGYAKTVRSSLQVSGVDGLVLVIGWNSIEPAMGQYQWAMLDQWMNLAISSGKKINLTLVAGVDTPPWLFMPAPNGAGANPLSFTVSPHGGATGVCDSETVAAPWDAAFLGRWDSILAALAAHLKSAGTYNAVTLLRLTGINRTTDELRLPAETPQSTGLACVSNAITIWQQAGYRPSMILQGWDSITTSFQKNFPDKAYSVAIIPQNPFPRIAEDGSIIQGTVPDQNEPLLSLAAQKFTGRLVVQFNFLMPGEPASPAVIDATQQLGTLAAFQTNNYFGSTGQGAACSEPVTNPTPCTAQTYLTLLETGIFPLGQSNSLRAQYIEIFPANATAFPDDIQDAHFELVPDTLTLEVAKQKGSGKLIIYVTSNNRNATLSATANPIAAGQQPITLGNLSKTDPSGNEFFIIKKGLPPIGSVQITSTSGGGITAQLKNH
jgi:Beta-galactosidase